MAGLPPVPELLLLDEFATRSDTGDRAEVDALDESHPIWPEVTSNSDNCLGQQCPQLEHCFVYKARRRATQADLIVVNHHLLLADYAVRERVERASLLPSVDLIVVDEAHALADAATTFFGHAVTERRLANLAKDLRGGLRTILDPQLRDGVRQGLDAFDRSSRDLIAAIRACSHQMPLDAALLARLEPLAGPLDQSLGWLQSLASTAELASVPLWAKAAETLYTLRTDMQACLPANLDNSHLARWIELRARDCAIVAQPVSVGPILQRTLLAEKAVRVFTSATLAAAGRFDLLLDQLGLEPQTATLTVASPFDFARQAMLYVPPHLPEPFAAGRDEAVSDAVAQLALAAGGATLALCSTHRAMATLAAALRVALPCTILVQGEAPKELLLQRFVREQPAVLVATMGFWQGVDLPATALRVVVLDKIPFPPPDDPLLQARTRRIEAEGRSSFAALSLPAATIALRQGFGRLVRSHRHGGVVAVLDPRLWTKRYGRELLDALPPARRATDVDEVRAFLTSQSWRPGDTTTASRS
jgi:ATP-dependent DNA helicase DinG